MFEIDNSQGTTTRFKMPVIHAMVDVTLRLADIVDAHDWNVTRRMTVKASDEISSVESDQSSDGRSE